MKLLFDTNVLISGFVTRGSSFDIIKDSVYKHDVYYTDHLIAELEETLADKFPFSDGLRRFAVSVIKKYFTKGKTADTAEKVCRDPDDNQVLADALANGIEVLVTGDKDLLVLKEYKGIRIIAPQKYWNL